MKKLSLLFVILSLFACSTPAEQVMSPVSYDKAISTRVAKNAALHWQSGTEQKSVEPIYVSKSNVGGSLPIAVASHTVQGALETVGREKAPQRFTYSYSKQQKAVFMTSLKNTLDNNDVFKQTMFVTDVKQVPADDVLININFKNTRVLDSDYNHKIILNVEMTIKSANKPVFTRNYVVESSDDVSGFKAQQTDVSKRLLDKVIKGITQWANR